PAGFHRLDNVAGVLTGALVLAERLVGLLLEHREISLEPVAALGGVAQIAAGLAMDPVAHVDPAADLLGTLAIPGQVFGKVAVALGGIDAEALEHVDAHLFLPRIDRVALEGGEQLVLLDLAALGADIDIPGLVVDARAHIVELAVLDAQHLRDLAGAVLHPVAEAHHVDAAIEIGRPGIHRHGIGIVEEQCTGLGDLPDVLAEIEDDRDVALAIEDAAGADRVADALVDTVFERNVDVGGESLEP